MAVRLTCTDNASGHDGLRWRMGPDSESVDIVVGETAPGVGELVVNDPIEPEACFSVVAYAGAEESGDASVCADTVVQEDFSTAQIGDAVGGGIYAGTNTIGGVDYHIISGDAASEAEALRWKVTASLTDGTASNEDGLANTQAMMDSGEDHPAAAHCIAYTGGGHDDWHLPARNQVTLLYNNLRDHPEFSENVASSGNTWSSTQFSGSDARSRWFNGGNELNRNKTLSQRVRPIRRVPV